MGLSLEQLRDDLIERWKRAFERFDEVTAAPSGASETVYTQYPAFALDRYTTSQFKPGARTSPTRTSDRDYQFQLDARKRPLRLAYEHRINRVSWRGAYFYRAHEVENIEVCTQTRVPDLYNRLVLAGDSILAEQRFICNGGGADARLRKLANAAKAREILSDGYNYFIYVTLYHVDNGVTRSADEHHEISGRTYRLTRDYEYARDGALQRIVQHWPDGEARILFASKAKPKLASRPKPKAAPRPKPTSKPKAKAKRR